MVSSATVKGGLFERAGLATLTGCGARGAAMRNMAMALRTRGARATRALYSALIGTVVGGNVTATEARIADSSDLSGKRTVETQTYINRNSAASDDTTITGLLTITDYTTSPIANKDGNPLGTR